MEGLLILGGLAVAGYVVLGFLAYRARRSRSKLERALNREQQRSNVAQAKLRAAQEHAEQVRTRTLAWDRPLRDGVLLAGSDLPPRVGIVPMPDRVTHRAEAATEVLEPVRDPEQILADFQSLPPVPSWRDLERIAGPAWTTASAQPEVETPESSPLYAETLESLPVIQPEADLLVPEYDKPARLELADPHDVEPLPADEEDVPQDESRVTDPPEDDDTDSPAGPPPGEPKDEAPDGPRIDETAPLAAVAVYRHDWSRAQHPVGPLHGARPHPSLARDAGQWMASRTAQVWARVWAVPQVRVRRPSWWRRLWRDLTAWWAERVSVESGPGWTSEELGDGHLIVRHRRGGGTWAVA